MKKFDVTLRSYGYVNEALSNCFHLYCKDEDRRLTELVYTIRSIIMESDLSDVPGDIEKFLNRFCRRDVWELRLDLSNPIHGVAVYQNHKDKYYLSIEWTF